MKSSVCRLRLAARHSHFLVHRAKFAITSCGSETFQGEWWAYHFPNKNSKMSIPICQFQDTRKAEEVTCILCAARPSEPAGPAKLGCGSPLSAWHFPPIDSDPIKIYFLLRLQVHAFQVVPDDLRGTSASLKRAGLSTAEKLRLAVAQ